MQDLDLIRKTIDECDRQIVEAIEKRFNAVKDIVEYKKKNDLPIFQPSREEEVLVKVESYLSNPEFSKELREIYLFMMEKSKEIQKRELKR